MATPRQGYDRTAAEEAQQAGQIMVTRSAVDHRRMHDRPLEAAGLDSLFGLNPHGARRRRQGGKSRCGGDEGSPFDTCLLGCGDDRRCTPNPSETRSTRASARELENAASSDAWSSTSPRSTSAPSPATAVAAVSLWARATASWPRPTRSGTTELPRKPLAPVTRILIGCRARRRLRSR
jgi:hypothetical protein